ncbi:hypothetical protein SEPCBS57363_005762 [Sporothrix epigloea]|uniref:Integral membrane protein n=1 Tax=Sporothrix epigloea TaxID=1892477 RepID=A0ABP0E2F5_9PEZI
MVSCGRVACVALPFVLAVVSIVALLVAALAGVADKNMYMFEVNTTGLSVSPSDAVSILDGRAVLDSRAPLSSGSSDLHDAKVARDINPSLRSWSTDSPRSIGKRGSIDISVNITATELNLGNLYDIGLWNYCVTDQSGTRTCTKPEFNWVAKTLNNSEHTLSELISSTGVKLSIPKEITDAVTAFSKLAKWTQIVFFIAFGALVLEIIFGLFTSCSRGVSCVTFVIASFTVVAVVGAAGLATAMSIIVAAAIKADAEKYGVYSSINHSFLVTVWISAAAAIVASIFWMFTVCCCHPESRRDRTGPPRHLDNDKVTPIRSYQPLNDPHQQYNNNNAYSSQYGVPQYNLPQYPQSSRSDVAYEPYSHSRV